MGIPVLDVFEVIRPQKIDNVSDDSGAMLGIINFHGNTIPVLSLRKMLMFKTGESSESVAWVIVKYKSTYVALVVDELCGFARPEDDVIDASSEEFSMIANKISFFFRGESSVIPVLNIHLLLEDEIENKVLLKS